MARLPGTLRQELDLFVLLPRFAAFLAIIEKNAPAPLAGAAGSLRASGGVLWQEILDGLLAAKRPSSTPCQIRLRRMASLRSTRWRGRFFNLTRNILLTTRAHPPLHATPAVCPLCSVEAAGGSAAAGRRRRETIVDLLAVRHMNGSSGGSFAHGCGEEDVQKLAVYSAKEIAHVRVEACDTCHHYIKTVDLTKDGHAVPVVDELATIPLNLWAADHGYTKIQRNLLGI